MIAVLIFAVWLLSVPPFHVFIDDVLFLSVAASPAEQAPPIDTGLGLVSFRDLDVPGDVVSLEATNGGAIVRTTDPSSPFLARPCGGEWCIEPIIVEPPLAPPPDLGLTPLPDGGVAASGGDIQRAWYIEPTERYGHGVLGDAIEAGGLAVVAGSTGVIQTLLLDEADVFEDITPRIIDLDGDGRNEVVALQSSRTAGGSLAVYALRDDELRLLARTPSIGTPNRWLNVAAIEDFDGDGTRDIAVVETPHIGGELQLWSGASLLRGEARLGAATGDFSNHAIGSRALGLSAIVPFADEETGPILALPSADRRSLRFMGFGDGAWREEAAPLPLPGRVATNIVAAGNALLFGLDNGALVAVAEGPPGR